MTDNKKNQSVEKPIIEEVKDKRNKLTQKTGLTFNVNMRKKLMKENIKLTYPTASIMASTQSAIGITAAIEQLCRKILTESSLCIKEDVRGLKQVTVDRLINTVNLDLGLRILYEGRLQRYDHADPYNKMLLVDPKELDQMIDSVIKEKEKESDQEKRELENELDNVMTSVDKTIKLTDKAKNLLCFLMYDIFKEIIRVCVEMVLFSKRSMISGRCILTAINIIVKNNILCESISKEVARAIEASGSNVNSDTNRDLADKKDDEEDVDGKEDVENVKENVEDDNDDDNSGDEDIDANSEESEEKPKTPEIKPPQKAVTKRTRK